MNKRLLVFGIVFVLLMVGFVNASFNTVNFTTTEYDTGDNLTVNYWLVNNTFNNDLGNISYGDNIGSYSWSNPSNVFDDNIGTYAEFLQSSFSTSSNTLVYIQKDFDEPVYIKNVSFEGEIRGQECGGSWTGTIYLNAYYKNSTGSWVLAENMTSRFITDSVSLQEATYNDVFEMDEIAYGIRFTGEHIGTGGSNCNDYLRVRMDEASWTSYPQLNNTNQYLDNGTEEIYVTKDNYYTLENQEITIPSTSSEIIFIDMYNSLLNITATDNSTGSPINTFNASIELKNGTTVDYGTTTGSIEMIVLDGETYNITVSSDAAQYVTSTEEVTISGATDSYEFNVFTFNSVRINVYDGLDNGLMSQNVTIQTISELASFENVTSTGTILIDFLTPNDYELRFVSDGYNTVSKFITVSNDSTQIVNAYMILNNDSESQQVHVTNIGTPINTDFEGAVVRLQQENIGGDSLYVTIQESITNSEGDTNVWVVRDASTFYRFQVIYNGTTLLTTTKTAFLPSVTETIELLVDTSEAGDSILEDDLSLSYTTTWSGVNNETFTFDWSDASSTIVGGRLLVTGQYLNVSLEEQTISDVSFVGASGTLQYTLPILNNTKYTVYAFITYSDDEKLVYSAPITFEGDILIDPNSGILIAGLVFIVTIFATYLLGPLWSGTIGFASLLLLTMLNIIILPVTIITSFIAFFFLMFVKIRRGQQ